MALTEFVVVTAADGTVIASEWLARAVGLHRQLRPLLPESSTDYAARMREVFATGGRLVLFVQGEAVLALALWRVIENTYEGQRFHIDDLVTDESQRSQGYGKRLFGWLEDTARALGCNMFTLDSGVQRTRAHKFYFREGMHIPSFCFRKVI